MKIAVAHNFYREAGGEDAAVRREIELLRRNGQEVSTFEISSNTIEEGYLSKFQVARSLSYSDKSRTRFSEFLSSERPEIVHVHNFFPLLTPSIYDACEEHNIPVVQTLHNYRISCSNALLLRDGKPCELCVQGSAFNGVLHACYRNSRVATLPVAKMIDYHRRQDTWNKKVTRFIALTEFSKSVFLRAGLYGDKISVKPNFVSDPYVGSQEGQSLGGSEKYALFVGRLSPEKGLKTLLGAWKSIDFPLRIVGTGPLEEELHAFRDSKNLSFLGGLPSADVSSAMKRATFLVMPSECYETFGSVVVEAFAHGIPVIVSDLGSPCELVENNKTGLHFKSGDSKSLIAVVQKLINDSVLIEKMGVEARKVYLEKYTEEQNFRILMEIYLSTQPSKASS